MIKRLFFYIRTLIGFCFVTVGAFILPNELRNKREAEPEQEESTDQPKKEEIGQLVPFKDLASYFSALAKPNDRNSACISIVNKLKTVSEEKQCPVRLTVSTTCKFDRTGDLGGNTISTISGYSKGRWQKLCDVDIGSQSIYPLIAEMIEAMAQDGWACMNDGNDQLHLYLSNCVPSSEQFVVDSCKRNNITGTVRVIVGMQTDSTPGADKNAAIVPQIVVKVTTSLQGRAPVESSHSVYFHRQSKSTTAQA